MNCPGCSQEMSARQFERNYARLVALDICHPCASLWFDGLESLALTPGAVLELFTLMSDNQPARRNPPGDRLACPRCHRPLALTTDMQRATRFRYWRCPAEHGRFITFFEFLREKNFVRPLSAAELADLKQHVKTVSCSGCGAPVDLNTGAACPYCRSPLSMLDPQQVEKVVEALKREEARRQQGKEAGLDAALAARLAEDRAAVHRGFARLGDVSLTFGSSAAGGLVEEGLAALVRMLKGED
jgi:uncharacterized protein YbaR (Trm112 family)